MLLHKIILFEFISPQIPRIIVAIIFLVLTISCASVDSRFKQAAKKDTVQAYDEFLNKYPDSKYTEDAKERRKQAKLKRESRRAKLEEVRKQRKKKQEERKKQIDKKKEQLSESAKKRIKSGEQVPAKPNDPGYALVICEVPNLNDDVVYVRYPSGLIAVGGTYVCANTRAGKEIVHWRKWYCNGESEICVTGKWNNGEPSFYGAARKQKTIINTKNGQYVWTPYRLK